MARRSSSCRTRRAIRPCSTDWSRWTQSREFGADWSRWSAARGVRPTKCSPISARETISLLAKEYRIILQPEAYEGMQSAYEYIEQHSPEHAHDWATGLMDAIN